MREKGRQGKQFDEFRATLLYCPRCKEATPVRETFLPDRTGSIVCQYRCSLCAEQTGTRTEGKDKKS